MEMLLCLALVAGLALHTAGRPSQGDDAVQMTFRVEGEEMTLNMKRNSHIDPRVPVFIGHEGQISRWNSPDGEDKFAAYLDNEKGASFILREEDGRPSYTGTFQLGGEAYVMEPAHKVSSHHKRSVQNVDLNHLTDIEHVVYKSEEGPDYQVDYRFKPELADRYSFSVDDIPANFAVSENYCVEMLLVLDYALYKEFSTKYGSHDSAIRELKYFFAHVVNGIDQRYLTINDFSIHVRMVALYITTTPEDSYWTMADYLHDAGDPFDWTHAYKALDAMEDWVPIAETMFPTFDQLTLYTGNSLFGSYLDDGSHRSIGGLANIGAICTPTRVAINQVSMVYAATQTGAHEMGHNLGAQHDGTGNTCTSRDQYVMANAPGTLKETNYLHPYEFSVCSKKYIRDLLLSLQYRDENCLLNMADHIDQDQFYEDLRKLPGQYYSLDEQCQQMKGSKSYHCGGGIDISNICLEMECYDSTSKQCQRRAEQRAATGTTCGNKKWCQKAKCVYDPAAPEAPDHCVYGDWKGVFRMSDGREYTCEQMMQEKPWECYRSDYSDKCCETCEKMMDPSKPGCEWGDHAADCETVHERPKDCYLTNTLERCCRSCELLKGDDPDCLYGDKASWCATMDSGQCYGSHETCCVTCPALDSGNPECRWGDKASWCPTREAYECYGSLKDTCCDFCIKQHTGVPGCEYGDRSRHCTQADCDDPSRSNTCCATCSDNQPVPTTTTTKATPLPPPEDCKDTAGWCATMPIRDCYVSEHTCCRRCTDNKLNVPGCEWGDKVSWCAGQVANCEKDTNVKDNCCQSCK